MEILKDIGPESPELFTALINKSVFHPLEICVRESGGAPAFQMKFNNAVVFHILTDVAVGDPLTEGILLGYEDFDSYIVPGPTSCGDL